MSTARPPRAPTLRDVAHHAGVSVATVSRALRGDPAVDAGLAERARRAAAQVGYVPNAAARALRGDQNVIAMLADDVGTEAIAQMAAAMETAAIARGVDVTVSSAGADPHAQMLALQALRALRPRAIVLTGSWLDAAAIAVDLRRELDAYTAEDAGRVVTIGPTDMPFDSVGFDDLAAGRLVGTHMAAMGRRRALILAGGAHHHAFRDRARGFMAALDSAGIADVRVRHSPVTRDHADAITAAEAEQALPDLILAGNDRLALGALRALHRLGVDVPERTAVSGVDDIGVARWASPALTTVALPFDRAGSEAVRLALGSGSESVTRVLLEGELRVRDSSRTRRAES